MKTNVFNRLHIVALFAILLLASGNANAQSNAKDAKDAKSATEQEKIFRHVEQMPEFPGGEAALMKFINENLRYPVAAIENGIQGRVTVQFVVKKDGSVDDVTVLHGVDSALDQEAIRVCKTFPKFIPGKQNGQPVNVWFTLPIFFRLE